MLKNMVAVVTGAVNGLGRQTLTHLCNESAHVFGCDIRDDNGELKEKFGDKVGFLQADVRSEKDMEDVFSKTMDRFGRVDILVNCAGIASAHTTASSSGTCFHVTDFTRLLEINVGGQFNASRLAAVEMAKNKPDKGGNRGVIILTSGFAAKSGRKGQAAIGAGYGAVDSMTLPMSRDLDPLGIRVATISPGIFSTPLTSSLTSDVQEYISLCQAFPYRFGEPLEYSQLVLQVIQNKFINGEVLSIDGGLILPIS